MKILKIITKNQEIEIINRYTKDRWTLEKLNKKFKITVKRIKELLINNNIALRKASDYKFRDVNITNKIIQLYSNSIGIHEISINVNKSDNYVISILKENKVKIRNISESRRCKFSREVKDEIIKLYEKRIFFKDIGRKFNITPSVVRSILLWNGIKLRNRSENCRNRAETKLTIEQELEICNLYNGGMGSCRLGDLFHLSFTRVKDIVRKHGFTIREGMGDWGTLLTKEDEIEICRLYRDEFWGQQNLRQKFHTHEDKIKEILLSNNIKIRNNKESSKAKYSINKKFGNEYGYGYCGRYNGVYFRSLNELSFMIYLDNKNISWKSAENKNYCVIYYDSTKKKDRRYYPDFIVENRLIVEIKPKDFWKSNEVRCKAEAAKTHFEKYNLLYKIIDFSQNLDKIKIEYLKGNITFKEKDSPNWKRFISKLNS